MGVRYAVIITVLLSQSLCEARGRALAASILQGLLSSNPQLLKMVSNKLATSYCPCGYEVQNPAVIQNGAVIQQNQKIQCSPAQYQVQNVIKDVPVVTKETQTVQQTQYPAQYATVQQAQTAYPACSSMACPYCSPATMVNPFLPAASPISALCPPTSNLLPPMNPSLVRSQFLRKIPIPPPCL